MEYIGSAIIAYIAVAFFLLLAVFSVIFTHIEVKKIRKLLEREIWRRQDIDAKNEPSEAED